jgi:MFS family permease
MIRQLIAFAIDKPIINHIILLFMLVLAIFSYQNIPKEIFPPSNLDQITIMGGYPGASADVLDKMVVKTIEDEVKSVSEIENIETTIQNGSFFMQADIKSGSDNQLVLGDVKDVISNTRRDLPADMDEPTAKITVHDFPLLLVAISAPIFGAVADYSRSKKKFLFFNCYLTVIFTALLYFVKAGNVFTGILFFIIANFGFNSGNVFYNALLPDIASRDELGKVSGLGWGIGYIGGLLSLVLILPLVNNHLTRLVFPTVAVFFGVFALFTFFLLKEVRKPSQRTNYFKTALKRISNSVRNIRHFRELLKFIIGYLIYNDGIIIVISFAAIYGATRFGMNQKQLITYFIIANVTSMFGALIFGFVLDKIGAKKTISITLFIWLIVASGMTPPAAVSTKMYHLGELSGDQGVLLQKELEQLQGVREVMVIAAENIACLKVDMKGFDKDAVEQLVTKGV